MYTVFLGVSKYRPTQVYFDKYCQNIQNYFPKITQISNKHSVSNTINIKTSKMNINQENDTCINTMKMIFNKNGIK